MKTIVLVQGPKSAQYWISHLPDIQVHKWICYDGLAASLLEQKGISMCDDSFYFDGQHAQLKQLGDLAHRLSLDWFHRLPNMGKPKMAARFERFFSRTFQYSFLCVFRAFLLLDKIREKEGRIRILTTDENEDNPLAASIRWGANNSPIPLLLKHLNVRWEFQISWRYSVAEAALPGSSRAFYACCQWVMKNSARFRNGEIIFSGNADLLRPVRDALAARSFAESLEVKNASRLRHVLLAFNPKVLPIAYPLKATKPLPVDLSSIRKILQEDRAFVVNGMDLLPIIWNKIEHFYHYEMHRIQELYYESFHLLRHLKPKVLIVDEDVTEFNRALVVVAQTLSIPSLVVQHGLPGNPLGFAPLEANFIAVWGEEMRNILTGWGIEESKIIVTGCPKYDSLSKQKALVGHAGKVELCNRLGLRASNLLVLVIPGALRENALEIHEEESNSSNFEVLKAVKYFVRIASLIPELNFIIKFRVVAQSTKVLLAHIMEQITKSVSNVRWLMEGLATQCIGACDITFNSVSSACLEAVLLGKPVVQMNFSKHEDTFPFVKYGIAVRVTTFEEALSICKDLESGTLPVATWIARQESIIAPFLLANDGKSAERISDFVVQILEKPPQLKTKADITYA